jgi:hypothetical protein
MHKPIHIFFSIILFSISLLSKAQPTLDTIKYVLKQKPQLFGELDSRNSFISNSRAKVVGGKIGLNYGSRLYLGLGYSQLSQPAKNFDKEIYYTNSNQLPDSIKATLKFFYFSVCAEYVYYQTKHWLLSIPLQLGVGKTDYQYSILNQKKESEKSLAFVYEPAISVQYKFVKWVGVGVDIGFRFMATDYKKLNQKFNSPTYAFNFILYYSELYKSLLKIMRES